MKCRIDRINLKIIKYIKFFNKMNKHIVKATRNKYPNIPEVDKNTLPSVRPKHLGRFEAAFTGVPDNYVNNSPILRYNL